MPANLGGLGVRPSHSALRQCLPFAFWGQTRCEYKVVFKCFACLDLRSLLSVKISSMHSALPRLEWEDGENESPARAPGAQRWSLARWPHKSWFRLGGQGRGGSEHRCSRTEGLRLSSNLHPANLWGGGAALNPASMACYLWGSHPRPSRVRTAAQREVGSLDLSTALALW